MAEGESKEQQNKTGSDKSRIKNITNAVHPEYSSRSRRQSNSAAAAERRTEEIRRSVRMQEQEEERAQRIEETRRKRARAERRKKIIRRRRRQRIFRIVAVCLVLIAMVMTVMTVKNYNSGSRHDNKGIKAYENSEYDIAVQEFKEAVSYDSNNAGYYIHLGMTYIEQKAYDEALGYFNQAENYADHDEDTALLNRGRGIACLYQGDYEKAISWLNTALRAADQNIDIKKDILYYKAEAEEKSGEYTSAVASYSQIIEMQDDAGARMNRGMAYMFLQNYVSAETDLYSAINQSRKSYSIYRALYAALMAQGKTEDANKVLNDALKLSGSSGEDYFNRGMIYIDLGDHENAVSALQTSYDKGYKAALLGLGEVSIQSSDYTAAIGYYETFFQEADMNNIGTSLAAKSYNQYAVCLLAAGDYEKAAEMCESGLKYNDRSADASLSFNLIAAYEKLGRWDDAYNLAKDYISKYPDDAKGMKEYQFLESRSSQ